MGSKNKNESNGVAVADGLQLMLAINLDDLESIETAAESAAPEAPVVNTSAPALDSDEAVARTLHQGGKVGTSLKQRRQASALQSGCRRGRAPRHLSSRKVSQPSQLGSHSAIRLLHGLWLVGQCL
jgi:hypothetical protein